jgi:hypothetical protein
MRVEAAVHEWTLALASIEVLARDSFESFFVLFDELVLLRATLH